MPCFENVDVNLVIRNFEGRFHSKKNDKDLSSLVDELIRKSYNNFWTNKYDTFQKMTNGILP